MRQGSKVQCALTKDNAVDWYAIDSQTLALRPYLGKCMRGSDSFKALERIKLMKLQSRTRVLSGAEAPI